MYRCTYNVASYKATHKNTYVAILLVPFKFTNILAPDCNIRLTNPSLPQSGQSFGKVKGIAFSTIL